MADTLAEVVPEDESTFPSSYMPTEPARRLSFPNAAPPSSPVLRSQKGTPPTPFPFEPLSSRPSLSPYKANPTSGPPPPDFYPPSARIDLVQQSSDLCDLDGADPLILPINSDLGPHTQQHAPLFLESRQPMTISPIGSKTPSEITDNFPMIPPSSGLPVPESPLPCSLPIFSDLCCSAKAKAKGK